MNDKTRQIVTIVLAAVISAVTAILNVEGDVALANRVDEVALAAGPILALLGINLATGDKTIAIGGQKPAPKADADAAS